MKDLYDVDPRERLRIARLHDAAAATTVPPRVDDLPPELRANGRRVEELGDIMSPINAWLLFVGPSYGAAPADLAEHFRYAGPQAPTLGRKHPLSASTGRFFVELGRWGTEAFSRSTVLSLPEDAWALTGQMNLIPGWAGDASRLADSDLARAAPRLWEVVEIVRPRLVVALTGAVYRAAERAASECGGTLGPEQRDLVPGGGQTYRPRWRWAATADGWSFLIAAAPNHPSRISLQIPDQTYSYLARQVHRGVEGP
jgi:hypothetical protein